MRLFQNDFWERLIFGYAGLILFAGINAGYLYYEFVHYSVHHKRKQGWTWFDFQRKNHLRHHFQDATHRFGVISPLWDIIFRTYGSKSQSARHS